MEGSWADNQNLGVESLLGPDADGVAAPDARDVLALASRYLANWYKATKGSEDQDVWWQRIDTERAKVELAYKLASQEDSTYFLTRAAKAAYTDAAHDWPQLWRDLKLSADTLPEPSLIDEVASIVTAPFSILPTLGNEVGKAVGGAVGNLVRQVFPYVLLTGGIIVVYTFREPILLGLKKAAGALTKATS